MIFSSISPVGTIKDKNKSVLGCVFFQDLLPDMMKSWPDLLNPSSTGFW